MRAARRQNDMNAAGAGDLGRELTRSRPNGLSPSLQNCPWLYNGHRTILGFRLPGRKQSFMFQHVCRGFVSVVVGVFFNARARTCPCCTAAPGKHHVFNVRPGETHDLLVHWPSGRTDLRRSGPWMGAPDITPTFLEPIFRNCSPLRRPPDGRPGHTPKLLEHTPRITC